MKKSACCERDAWLKTKNWESSIIFCILRFARALFSKGSFDQSDGISQFFVSLLETNSKMVGLEYL